MVFRQKPLEQDFVNSPAKPFAAIDDHHGNTLVVPLAKVLFGINIDDVRMQSVPSEQFQSVIAQMTALSGVEDDAGVFHASAADDWLNRSNQFSHVEQTRHRATDAVWRLI